MCQMVATLQVANKDNFWNVACILFYYCAYRNPTSAEQFTV